MPIPSTTATANAEINGPNTPNLNMANTQLDYMPRGRNQFSVDERPWTDPEILERLFVEENRSSYDIAEELGCGQTTVFNWLNRHGIEKPWKDSDRLEELYHEKGMSMREIADEMGCSPTAIQKNMEKNGIETRKSNKEKPPAYSIIQDGYCVWWSKVGSKDKHVRVHRLLAVAEYGFDAVCGMHVHHKNNIPWDNRADNIELMTPSNHMKHHRRQERKQ